MDSSKLPRNVLNCSSRALETAVQDNNSLPGSLFLDNGDASSILDAIAAASTLTFVGSLHKPLLEAEKELALNYRKSALLALEK